MSQPADTIILSTGYTIELGDPDWRDHLVNALIGEIFVSTSTDPGPGAWDQAMAALVNELVLVCESYGLPPFVMVRETITRLDRFLRMTQETDEGPCYLCTVEDGNATPFDENTHTLCLMCAAKLRALGAAELSFPFGPVTVSVSSQAHQEGEN